MSGKVSSKSVSKRGRANVNFPHDNSLVPVAEINAWFEHALKGPDKRRPSANALSRLARDIQVIINNQNNRQLQQAGDVPLLELKDVSVAQLLDTKLAKVRAAALQMLAAFSEVEKFAGGYTWEGLGMRSSISFHEAKELIRAIALHPDGFRASPPTTDNIRVGRPKAGWHEAGREIAQLIKAVMHEAGYRGRLRTRDPESVVAIVGAHVVNRAYGTSIEPRGFAQAMSSRDRRRPAIKKRTK